MNIYYVYAYVREDGTPYYIGKGKGNRAFYKHRKIPVPNDKLRIIFIFQDLMEQDALNLECQLIKYHGRKNNNTGILRNLTDGGEGCSGAIRTEETLLKMRKPRSKISHWKNKKRGPMSEEHKQKLRKPKNKNLLLFIL